MLSLVVLVGLSQLDGLVQWTDDDGVVHVGARAEAPARATPLSGEGYSRVDADSRPPVLPDGGTREADSSAWRARLLEARGAAARAKLREVDARAAVANAEREVCATSTAEARSSVRVFSHRGGTVVQPQGRTPTWVRRGHGVLVEDQQTTTSSRCEAGAASPTQHAELRRALELSAEADAAVRELERAAVSASLPLRHWR